MLEDFLPPSVVLPIPTTTTTHLSDIPGRILNGIDDESLDDPIILGVDEAGRGPVLGPMVYGVAYSRKTDSEVLKKFGFDDSKKLTEQKREELMRGICGAETDLFDSIGWATTSITARDISAGMLRPRQATYNLNSQAHDVTMELIDEVMRKGVKVREVYVDTVGPPISYQKKLQDRFPTLKITVTKKADSLFPIVSAASIVAKVTRDYSLFHSAKQRQMEVSWGSGYPSDPRTCKWLNGEVDPLFGWDHNVRYSWQTAKEAIKRSGGLVMTWEDDLEEKDDDYGDIGQMFNGGRKERDVIKCDWFIK
ncbi:DEKNAAC101422 [Brettanomyces naardenensis]|uniref:Ribonuclease n=1 Tax=Brettanomyces naardenensis TaxID=13370 RepID=A0A448YI52_BRENA|nr:DEKNAAC101422 [Brettanomyces naardenensis]